MLQNYTYSETISSSGIPTSYISTVLDVALVSLATERLIPVDNLNIISHSVQLFTIDVDAKYTSRKFTIIVSIIYKV